MQHLNGHFTSFLGLFMVLLFLHCNEIKAQSSINNGYQKDSLQIKVYTTLVIDENFQFEEVFVRQLFCDFCNEDQAYLLEEEAKRRTFLFKDSPEYYKKPGEHKMALYIRMDKDDFKNLKVKK